MPMTPMINDNLPRSELKMQYQYSAGDFNQEHREMDNFLNREDFKRKIEGFRVSMRERHMEDLFHEENQIKENKKNSCYFQEKPDFFKEEDRVPVTNNFIKTNANEGDLSILYISRETTNDNEKKKRCKNGAKKVEINKTKNTINF